MALVKGSEVSFLSSKEFYENEQAMLFHVKHHWWNKGITSEKFIELNDSTLNNRVSFDGFAFSILDLKSKRKAKLNVFKSELDLAILQSTSWNLVSRIDEIESDILILSGALGTKTKDKIVSECSRPQNLVTELPYTLDIK